MSYRKRTTVTIEIIIKYTVIALVLLTTISIPGSAKTTPGGIVTDAGGNSYDLYNINGQSGVYATNPGEVISIQNLLNGIGQMSSKDAINNYIKKYSPQSPITADMIINAANQYPGVSCPIMMAMMRQDSNFADPRINSLGKMSPNGARQRAYRYHNPGNVGDTDSGANVDWGTWQAGVNAVAQNLAHRKVSTPAVVKPVITSITPTQTTAGDFALTINGNNFDQSNVVDRIYRADGTTYVGQGTITSRTASKIVVTEHMTGVPSGTYVVKVRNNNNDANTESNGVNLQINAAVVTLTVSPSSGQQGTTFTFSGTGYTQNGAIAYHVKKPDNTEFPVATLTASSSGVITYPYKSTTASMVGTYTIWAIDTSTGRQSTNVQETITRSSKHLK